MGIFLYLKNNFTMFLISFFFIQCPYRTGYWTVGKNFFRSRERERRRRLEGSFWYNLGVYSSPRRNNNLVGVYWLHPWSLKTPFTALCINNEWRQPNSFTVTLSRNITKKDRERNMYIIRNALRSVKRHFHTIKSRREL